MAGRVSPTPAPSLAPAQAQGATSGALVALSGSSDTLLHQAYAGTDAWDEVSVIALQNSGSDATFTIGWGGPSATAAYTWAVKCPTGVPTPIIQKRLQNSMKVWGNAGGVSFQVDVSVQRVKA